MNHTNATTGNYTTNSTSNTTSYANDSFTSIPPFHASSSIPTEILSVTLLIVGVLGNSVISLTFLARPWGRKPMVVDKSLGLIGLTGFFTNISINTFNVYSQFSDSFPSDRALCQFEGFLFNLLALTSLWFTALLALERFFLLVSPHEHRLTFNALNQNVILSGVLVLLLVEVCGPIYGWSEYAYVEAIGACMVSPQSNHVLTYTGIHTTCYVAAPVLVTCVTTCYTCRVAASVVSVRGERLNHNSQVLNPPYNVLALCTCMLLFIILHVPYHVLFVAGALGYDAPDIMKVVCYWGHLTSITCVYPVVLLAIKGKEIFPCFQYRLSSIFSHCKPSVLEETEETQMHITSTTPNKMVYRTTDRSRPEELAKLNAPARKLTRPTKRVEISFV